MDKEKKEEYFEAFMKLLSLFGEIANKRSGESWWSPPGEDYYFSCDMGYVLTFIGQLEDWLNDAVDPDDCKPNSRLRNPPTND